jgi:hypothetical protein
MSTIPTATACATSETSLIIGQLCFALASVQSYLAQNPGSKELVAQNGLSTLKTTRVDRSAWQYRGRFVILSIL